MDGLQGDIDALEREKTELRERVKELSRKNLMEGIVRQSSAGLSDLHDESKNHSAGLSDLHDESESHATTHLSISSLDIERFSDFFLW